MICDPCKMQLHQTCANTIDMDGHPRPCTVRGNWCDCQHRTDRSPVATPATQRVQNATAVGVTTD